MYESLEDIDRSREAMRRRIKALNAQHCSTARELQAILLEQAKLGKGLMRADVMRSLLRCFGNLIKNTPHDTGRLRAGWQISENSAELEWKPDVGEYNEFKNNIAAAIEQKTQDLSLTNADTIYIFNNVEYLLALDAGWSKRQAGNFIGLFLQELKAELQGLANK